MRGWCSWLIAAAFLVVTWTPALAVATNCPHQFAGGMAPVVVADGLADASVELCYGEFALLHSGLVRSSLWAAEHLTSDRISEARKQEREDRFFPELNVPAAERAELSDYSRSGWDRGHLAPSADMSTDDSQWQSFSLANAIPQAPANNRYLWRDIEIEVRKLAMRYGEIYVVTGPLYLGDEIEALNGRVYVPTHVFKAVYIPHLQGARAYVTTNTDSPKLEFMSIPDLEGLSGIRLFPALTAAELERPIRLPNP